MLAEAAHSAADTLNQVFLLTSLRQADRPADADHPFGHGQERYFWSLLAAFGIFIAGAGFSVFEGLLSLTRRLSEKLPMRPNVFIDPTQTHRTPPAGAARSAGPHAAEA
jgi:divalent metal cation (Fe/Co/Zn/Cd) transporter